MSAPARRGFEPWAFVAFALAGLCAGAFVFLGLRPGGAAPVFVYRFGLLFAGWAAAVAMLIAMIWSLRRRPVLQRGRAWPLVALGASLWFCSLPIAYPSSHEGKFSPTRFGLPFEGKARVRYGGLHKLQNPLLFDPARRFGTAFERRSESLEVLAPADGTLLDLAAGRMGDVLVLATGVGEYCVLEGLVPGSCSLTPGSAVRAGERLGSGAAWLSVHLQDRPSPGAGEGIPMRYWNYEADGRTAESGVPVPPQEVSRAVPGRSDGPPGR